MQLTVRDASELLKLPEKTLYRLIKRNEIPFYRLNKSCFFNRAELLEWAISRKVEISPRFFSSPESEKNNLPFLADALENGGIQRLVACLTKTDVLRSVVALIPGISPSDGELIFNGLMARETLGSTAIGNGIAIPHVRNPIILNIKGPAVILCFLDHPIDFGALDGKKVSTIFTMISPTARIHLHLLARLSYVLQNKDVLKVLSVDCEGEKILSRIRTAENNIAAEKGSRG
jgi:PTS system nitrogen regulatory IIA component